MKNLYKIHFSVNSEPNYFFADDIIEAINKWKKLFSREKDPELVEWISDNVF